MKNKASENNIYNGIKIANSINLTVPKTPKNINIIPLVIIAFFGIYGSVFSFFSMFKTTADITSVRYYSILFLGAFTLLFMLPKKFHLIILPVIGLYGFLLYRKWTEFIIGFKMLFNQTYSSIYPNAGNYFRLKNHNTENIELFLAFAIFLLAAVICYTVYVHPDFFLGFIVTFPIIESGLYFGKSPSIIYAFMLIIFWITLLVLKCCGYYQKFTKKDLGFIRKNNSFIAKPGIKFKTAGISVTIMAAVCSIIFALTAFLSSITDYKRSDSINDLRSDLKLAASEFSFENFGESIDRFSATLGIGKTKLYSHKLGNVGAINFKNTTEITVDADDKFDDNIYLKGYTGSVYSGDEWKTFPEEVYEQNKNLLDSFKREKRYPQDMLTNCVLSIYVSSFTNMHIKSDYKNEKYNYTPYISVPSGEVSYIDDTSIEFENKNDYSFNVNRFQVSLNNFDVIHSEMDYVIRSEMDYDLSYDDKYADYTNFVLQNYCNVPDTEEMQEIYEKFITDHPIPDDYSVYQKLKFIRSFLSENAEYTLNPGKTPGSEDFVNYFLLKNHKGFCVHFATAGTILARMMGIPARYAEGYVIRSSDFNKDNLNADGTYTIDIKDSRSHAWSEVYVEHIGWVPIEFTPSSAAALNDDRPAATKSSQTNTKTTNTTVSKIKNTNTDKHTSSNSVSKNNTSASSSKSSSSVQNTKPLSLKFKVTLLFIIIFIVIFTVIALKHILKVRDRNYILKNDSPKNKITCAYESAVKLIEFSGIERSNMQYLEFAEYVKERLPDIFVNDSFREVTEIMLKAQLSDTEPTDEEVKASIKFYEELFIKIYEKNNILKKISMKYLKNL